jgi:hypothetical protein
MMESDAADAGGSLQNIRFAGGRRITMRISLRSDHD